MSERFSPAEPAAGRLQLWPLVGAAALVEVLAGAGVLPVWAGLAHEVALPPLDLVSDLGVLLARATSVPWFALGLAASLVARAAVLTLVVGWSRRRFGLALRFYLIALAPAYVGAALIDSAQVGLYAIPFWTGLVVVALTALILAPLPWRHGGVRRGLVGAFRHGARLPTLASYLLVLAALGGTVRLGGASAERAGVAGSALLTCIAISRLARPGLRPGRLRIGAVGFALAGLLIAELVPETATIPRPVPAGRAGSLLLVPGIDTSSGHGTMFRLDPRSLGYTCAATYYFSYRGVGGGAPRGESACPIRTGAPYARRDTERPLAQLDAGFGAQLAGLPAPVTVVTHSSGSWTAWGALAGGRSGRGKVDAVIMLSPLADPLGYPPPGHSGPGLVGAAGARLLTGLARRTNFSEFRLDAPLATQLMADPAHLRNLLARRLPAGIRALALPAAFDLPLLVGTDAPFPHAIDACPSRSGHSGVVTSPETARRVGLFLEARHPPGCPPWRTWEGAVAAGFRVPDPPGP